MGNCISWDRNKSIWALRILSEVLLCTGIVACVAAFTIEQGKPNIYFLVSGLCLFLFAAIGLASSFCLSHDGKKEKNNPVYTVTLPSAHLAGVNSHVASQYYPHSNLSVITGKDNRSRIFASMKSIPVDSIHTEVTSKHLKTKKKSDRLSSINEEKCRSGSTSDEGFNSGGQTNSSPDVGSERRKEERKQKRRKQRRQRKDGSESRDSRTSKSSDEYLTRI